MEFVSILGDIYNSNSLQLDKFRNMKGRDARGLNSTQLNQIK